MGYPSGFNISLMNYTYENWIFIEKKVNSIVLFADNAIIMNNSTFRISVIAIYTTSLYVNSS